MGEQLGTWQQGSLGSRSILHPGAVSGGYLLHLSGGNVKRRTLVVVKTSDLKHDEDFLS